MNNSDSTAKPSGLSLTSHKPDPVPEESGPSNRPKAIGVPPDIIRAFSVPQPDKYNIMIKGHEFCLNRSQAMKLYQALMDMLMPHDMEAPLEVIKRMTSNFFGVSLRLINSTTRLDRVVMARHAAMWLADKANITRRDMADSFGRHYTGIGYAIRQFQSRLDNNPKLRARIDALETQLKEMTHA